MRKSEVEKYTNRINIRFESLFGWISFVYVRQTEFDASIALVSNIIVARHSTAPLDKDQFNIFFHAIFVKIMLVFQQPAIVSNCSFCGQPPSPQLFFAVFFPILRSVLMYRRKRFRAKKRQRKTKEKQKKIEKRRQHQNRSFKKKMRNEKD